MQDPHRNAREYVNQSQGSLAHDKSSRVNAVSLRIPARATLHLRYAVISRCALYHPLRKPTITPSIARGSTGIAKLICARFICQYYVLPCSVSRYYCRHRTCSHAHLHRHTRCCSCCVMSRDLHGTRRQAQRLSVRSNQCSSHETLKYPLTQFLTAVSLQYAAEWLKDLAQGCRWLCTESMSCEPCAAFTP